MRRPYWFPLLESIPHLVGLLHDSVTKADRRADGLEAREICKGLSKLSVANDNKTKVTLRILRDWIA